MKILYIVSSYPPYRGGMGNVVFEEASRMVERGHEVHVATLRGHGVGDIEDEGGVFVHRFRGWIRYGFAGVPFGVLGLMKREKFDVVHLHLPFFGLQELFAVLIWFGWRRQFVVSYHMDIVSGGFVRFVSEVSRRVFLHTVLRRARAIFVASVGYARNSWLGDRWGDYEGKVIVNAFGVDLERFFPGDGVCGDDGEAFFCSRTTGCVDGGVVRFVFLGGLDAAHYFKGLGVVIDAFEELVGRDDWELYIGGDGDLRGGYEARVRGGVLDSRVEFAGFVSDEDLPGFYGGGDVFLFPSIDRSEAFGLVALEAQACGVAVIASRLDGVVDAVEDGVTGVVVEPGSAEVLRDAVVWFLENRGMISEMGLAARRRVEDLFSWDRHVLKLIEVYEEIDN